METINKHNFIHDFIPTEHLYEFYYEYFQTHPYITGIVYTASPSITYLLQALKALGRTPQQRYFYCSYRRRTCSFPRN